MMAQSRAESTINLNRKSEIFQYSFTLLDHQEA